VGTQVTCVRVYENGTYMYGGVPVCLSVVAVPTPRLVLILCALSCGFFMSMRRFNSYPWLVVWPWPVCRVAQGVMLDGRENRVVQYMPYWVIIGCCCYRDYLLYIYNYIYIYHCMSLNITFYLTVTTC